MKLIDTHAHPYWDTFKQDRSEMLERTWDACEAIISVGAGVTESKAALELAETDSRIFASIGIHPHDIERDKLEDLRPLLGNTKIVGIGECGLDFKPYLDHPIDRAKQKEYFSYQVNLANEMKLPVIIHARDCWEDLIPLLKGLKPNSGLIHSWTGGLKEADEVINLGLHISFSGMITYPANEHLRQVAKIAPENRILVETDAPFLPPQALRGQRNEPAHVKMVAELLAELRGVSFQEIAEATTTNARRLFSLPQI